MRRILSALLVACLFLVPPATAGDAGSIDDAPDSKEDALLITPGAYSGGGARFDKDWFRVEVPEGRVLHASFRIVSGHDWNSLYLHDTEASTWGARTGQQVALDPDGTTTWVLVDAFWGAMDYEFTLWFGDAPPQDDAGRGEDAGASRAQALSIDEGRIKGRLWRSMGDVADVYRFETVPGEVVDVYAATTRVEIFRSDGVLVGEITYYPSSFTPLSFSFLADGTPIYLRVSSDGFYEFSLDSSPRSDIVVEDVQVRPVSLDTEVGPTGAAPQREVVVTLVNVGAGNTRDAELTVMATHDGPTLARLVGRGSVELEPGERTTVVIPWDTTGQAGDFTIEVSVTNGFDLDVETNVGSLKTWVLVGGTTFGIDAFNHHIGVVTLGASTEYSSERIGAHTPVGFTGYHRGSLVVA